MSINLKKIPDIRELKPRITGFGGFGARRHCRQQHDHRGGCKGVATNSWSPIRRPGAARRSRDASSDGSERYLGLVPDRSRSRAGGRRRRRDDSTKSATTCPAPHGVCPRRMGGGTGPGCQRRRLARWPRKMGISPSGVNQNPSTSKDLRRDAQAEAGLAALKRRRRSHCLIIPNQKLSGSPPRGRSCGASRGRNRYLFGLAV